MPDEKEKQEEKAAEKANDRIDTLGWAAFLIWAGVVFLGDNLGYLDRFQIRVTELPFDLPFLNLQAWTLVFLGGAVIVTLEFFVRIALPEFRRKLVGTAIFAAILYGMALGEWDLIWPFILIGVGVAIIFGSLFRNR